MELEILVAIFNYLQSQGIQNVELAPQDLRGNFLGHAMPTVWIKICCALNLYDPINIELQSQEVCISKWYTVKNLNDTYARMLISLSDPHLFEKLIGFINRHSGTPINHDYIEDDVTKFDSRIISI